MRNVLIDRIDKVEKNGIIGCKFVSINEEIFGDHFPNYPILPAAITMEAILQLARIFIWIKSKLQDTLIPDEYNRFKFYEPIEPGQILKMQLTFQFDCENFEKYQIKANGMVENKVLVQGQILGHLLSFDTLHNKKICQSYLDYLMRSKNGQLQQFIE
jgi:3-hydroxyacyl-[acyl-carrier-protein] dehydratase